MLIDHCSYFSSFVPTGHGKIPHNSQNIRAYMLNYRIRYICLTSFQSLELTKTVLLERNEVFAFRLGIYLLLLPHAICFDLSIRNDKYWVTISFFAETAQTLKIQSNYGAPFRISDNPCSIFLTSFTPSLKQAQPKQWKQYKTKHLHNRTKYFLTWYMQYMLSSGSWLINRRESEVFCSGCDIPRDCTKRRNNHEYFSVCSICWHCCCFICSYLSPPDNYKGKNEQEARQAWYSCPTSIPSVGCCC